MAIYARVSTTKQVGGRFDSCEAQVSACQNYVAGRGNEGWSIVGSFTDPAYSGKDMERPGMRRLMKAIEAGLVRAVVVYRLERVLRSTDEWGPFRKFLKKHDCVLYSVTQDIEDVTPEGRFRNNILVSMSEYERNNGSVKTANKMRMQAERGFWNGGNEPYGYVNDPKAKKIHPHPDEAGIVRTIYCMAGELISLAEIARALTDRGVLTRRRIIKRRKDLPEPVEVEVGGNRFREDLLRKIISNPLYRGVVRFNGTEYKGQHEPLVSIEAWEAANAAISQAKASPKPTATLDLDRDKHFNLLKGLLYCGCCKGAFVPHASGKLDSQGRPYRYYTCNQVIHNRSVARCLVRQISAVAVEEAVVGLLGQMARHPTLIETVLDFGKANASGAQKELELRIRKLDREIEKVTASLGNLLNALADHGVSSLREEIRAKFEELKRRKEHALVERTRARQDLEALTHDAFAPAQICASLEKFEKLWPDFTQEEKREFVSLMVARVEVHSDKGKTEGRESARLVELKVKLHLPELLGGGADAESTARRLGGRRPSFTLNATVALAVGTGDTVILAPFHHRVTSPKTSQKRPTRQVHKDLHPIHRAIALAKKFEGGARRPLSVVAKEEGISAASICQLLKLTRLSEPVKTRLLALCGKSQTWRCGIRKLLPIVGLKPQQQMQALEKLLTATKSKKGRPNSAVEA